MMLRSRRQNRAVVAAEPEGQGTAMPPQVGRPGSLAGGVLAAGARGSCPAALPVAAGEQGTLAAGGFCRIHNPLAPGSRLLMV